MDEELRNPFKDLQSSYMQKKAYKSIGLVVCKVNLIITNLLILGTSRERIRKKIQKI